MRCLFTLNITSNLPRYFTAVDLKFYIQNIHTDKIVTRFIRLKNFTYNNAHIDLQYVSSFLTVYKYISTVRLLTRGMP
jgi:hypothetical protein